MSNRWSGICSLGVLALSALVPFARAADKPAKAPDGLLDAETLAGRIDQLLALRQQEKQVPPARLSDDAEFIRRAYLDLVGCIPSITDVRDFLDDQRPNKRRIWVDLLLEGKKPAGKRNDFNQHFANVWRAWILARVNNDNLGGLAGAIENWLRDRLRENTSYDRLVRAMITASPFDNGNSSPSVFYQINEFKPENLAASTSRLFLGIKLECAQCHDDRSGGSWTQGQFWSFAAFFSGVNPQRGQVSDQREIAIPGRKKTVRARFLDGPEPTWKAGDNPRAVLADWLVSPKNPYFARAGVNRLWEYFFGTGLIDPVDEQGAHNPPSHPELLDELARQFADHEFDLRYLIRAIVASQAYQRTSIASHPGQDDPHLFARMTIRGLSAEQLFDSLAEATEFQDTSAPYMNRFDNPMNLSPRQQFLSRFSHQDKPTDAPTSILQALYLMNSSFIADRTSLEQNKTLATLADQGGPDSRRIESLFLAVLSRKPTETESKRFVGYFVRGGPSGDRRKALADIFWALLNSAEFRLNH
jgi:hypothetical protein